MKTNTKTKNLGSESGQGNHGDDIGNDHHGPSTSSQGNVRRSTRKRSAPKHYTAKSKTSIRHWTTQEKEKLLTILGEQNNRQFSSCAYRYPISVIKKRIGTKSHSEVKRFLGTLEHRGAAMALWQMKHQAPLETWRQMADKLTLLTGDSCSRHLIRVCSVMALESKEANNSSTSKGRDRDEGIERTAAAAAAAPATTAAAAAAAPAAAAAAPATETPTSQPHAVSIKSEKRTRVNVTPTTLTSTMLACQDPEMSTSTVAPQPSRSPDEEIVTSAPANSETVSGSATATPAPNTAAPASAARGTGRAGNRGLQLSPDYVSIYKYIGSLMQGEQGRLGALESLVVLDCLNLVEEHLKGRNNTKQKEFSQERLLDILQNLHLSMDAEDAGKNRNLEADAGEVMTMADLIGLKNIQVQSHLHQADQLENSSTVGVATDNVRFSQEDSTMDQSDERLLPEDQSASSLGQTSQSNERQSSSDQSVLQGHAVTTPAAACKKLQQKAVGLGSLNPFNIPVKLLEIRKDK